MRYTLFLYSDEAASRDLTEADMQNMQAAFGQYIGALKEAGVFLDTDWLQPSQTASLITLKDGERRIQDGP